MKRIALAVLILALAGCASVRGYFEDGEQLGRNPYQRYQWFPAGPGAKEYVWHQVGRFQLAEVCGEKTFGRACAYRWGDVCVVFALQTEFQARDSFEGTSLRTHELRHCGIETPDGLAYDHDPD